MLLRALAMTLNTDGLGEEPRVLVDGHNVLDAHEVSRCHRGFGDAGGVRTWREA